MLAWLDSILGAISFFDLITPTAGHVQNFARGPAHTFHVRHGAGWGIYSVERVLQDAGCGPVWGKRIFLNTMKLSVRREVAQRGYWALHEAGVPVENGVPDNGKSPGHVKRASNASIDSADFLGW